MPLVDLPLPAEGSAIPREVQSFLVEADRRLQRFQHEAHPPGLELEIAPDDFDLIFSYPWPDEERLTAALFERHARGGALLLSYHEVGSLRLRRKSGKTGRPWGGDGSPKSQFLPPGKKPRRRR